MKFILILIGTLITLPVQGQNQFEFANLESHYVASDSIRLQVNTTQINKDILLFISHSYGLDIVPPEINDSSKLIYVIPNTIARKSGMLHLKLMQNNQTKLQLLAY